MLLLTMMPVAAVVPTTGYLTEGISTKAAAEWTRGGESRSNSKSSSRRESPILSLSRSLLLLSSVRDTARADRQWRSRSRLEARKQTTNSSMRNKEQRKPSTTVRRNAYISKEVWWERYSSVERDQRRHRLTAGLPQAWAGTGAGRPGGTKRINLEV